MSTGTGHTPAGAGDLFFELSVDPVCLMGRDGRFLRVNPAFCRVLGYDAHEVEGIRLFEFLHPEDMQPTAEMFERPPADAVVHGFRNRCRRRSGQWVHLEWHSAYDGQSDTFVAVARDVTDDLRRAEWLERTARLLTRTQGISGVGGWEVDAETHELFWTEQIARIHELPEGAPTPTVAEAIAFYHPEDVPMIRAAIEASLSRGASWNMELRIITAKGRERHVRAIAEPVREGGKVAKVFGTLEDITYATAVRDELRASRQRLRQVIDLVPLLIHAKDADGRFLLANKAFADMVGRSAESLVGVEDTQIKGDIEALAWARERDGEVLREGRIVRFTGSVRIDPKGGEHAFDIVKIPYDQGTGARRAVLTVASDVTRERRMDRLNESLRRLSLRLSQSQSLKESGRIVADECCLFFGYDAFFLDYYDDLRNVVVGIHNEDIPPGGDRPVPMPTFEVPLADYQPRLRFDGKPTLINRSTVPGTPEFVMMGDTQRFSMSLMYAPVRWGNKVIGIVSLQSYARGRYAEEDLADLELFAEYCGGALSRHRAEQERRVLEEQIHNARRLESLGILAGGIAHDFNNLLMGILGNAELAMLDVEEFSPAVGPLKTIVRTTQRAADLCRQMLAYAGRTSPQLEFSSLNEIVRDVVRMIEVTIAKNVQLRLHLATEVPAVRADATQLRQTVMNLILNSADALEAKGGEIAIRTGSMHCERALLKEGWIDDQLPPGQYVFVEVEDDGHGMDDETLKRIFDPFFTTKFAGRGLGLAAVLGIVRAHRGTIRVISEQGQGTTFRIYLPAAPEGEPRPPTPSSGQIEVGIVKGTVLFVDDDELIREAGVRFLELAGFTVHSAEDGMQAVEVFERHAGNVDVVVMDLTMPRLDGEGAMVRIRAVDPGVPILLSSGWSERDTAERFAGREPAGFLHKPYKPDVLVARVRELVAARRGQTANG